MRAVPIALFAAAVLVACAKDNNENGAPADTAAVTPAPATDTAAPAAAAPTDPQIAHIAVKANDIDIDHGKDAKGKATNAEVKAFAQKMITDHSAVNKQASDLATKLSLTPEDNPTSQQLQSQADQVKSELSGKSGADYDKAYIASEVTFHQQVLDALDKVLIPNAQNAELKALLEKVRPAVDGHLKMAQQIQAKLGQ